MRALQEIPSVVVDLEVCTSDFPPPDLEDLGAELLESVVDARWANEGLPEGLLPLFEEL